MWPSCSECVQQCGGDGPWEILWAGPNWVHDKWDNTRAPLTFAQTITGNESRTPKQIKPSLHPSVCPSLQLASETERPPVSKSCRCPHHKAARLGLYLSRAVFPQCRARSFVTHPDLGFLGGSSLSTSAFASAQAQQSAAAATVASGSWQRSSTRGPQHRSAPQPATRLPGGFERKPVPKGVKDEAPKWIAPAQKKTTELPHFRSLLHLSSVFHVATCKRLLGDSSPDSDSDVPSQRRSSSATDFTWRRVVSKVRGADVDRSRNICIK